MTVTVRSSGPGEAALPAGRTMSPPSSTLGAGGLTLPQRFLLRVPRGELCGHWKAPSFEHHLAPTSPRQSLSLLPPPDPATSSRRMPRSSTAGTLEPGYVLTPFDAPEAWPVQSSVLCYLRLLSHSKHALHTRSVPNSGSLGTSAEPV